jgi:uncharacterized protein YbjQ (UPF0145 family)
MNGLVTAYLQNHEALLGTALLIVGYIVGTIFQRNHLRSIQEREAFFFKLPAVTMKLKNFVPESHYDQIASARMVVGSVVITPDYFRFFLSSIFDVLGGKVKSYESIVDRARREAILRMKESAPMADIIVNTRLEMDIMQPSIPNMPIRPLAVYAYGTAIRLKKSPFPQNSEESKELEDVVRLPEGDIIL